MVYKPDKEYYTLPRSNFIKKTSNMIEDGYKEIDEVLCRLGIESGIHIDIKTPESIKNKKIKEITIKPSFDGKTFKVCYVYEIENIKVPFNTKKNKMGIDLGYNNLSVCAVTNGNNLLIDGKKIKSVNQYYHKRYSELSSKRKNQNVLTDKMEKLIIRRNNQMNYYICKTAKLIIEHAIRNEVGMIIIGYNDGFKDESLSKKYNQMAKSIPLARLRDRLSYLGELSGIEVKITNESYTSVSSFIDRDLLKKSEFSGKRIKRGLYRSKEGILINADLNGALNILRKCIPEIKVGSRGLSTPKRTFVV